MGKIWVKWLLLIFSFLILIQHCYCASSGSAEVIEPSGNGGVHIYIPHIVSASLQSIETLKPHLTDIYSGVLSVVAKVTVKNHLSAPQSVYVIWWVTEANSTRILVEGNRTVELDDSMSREVTASIRFDLPLGDEVVPTDKTYMFHMEIEYSMGATNARTDQLTTLLALSMEAVQTDFVYLIIIIVVMVIIVVIVAIQRYRPHVIVER